MLGLMHHMRGVQQGFGGDAADIQTRAAQCFAPFDAGDLKAKLPRADGRDIATWSRADYDYVICHHRPPSSYQCRDKHKARRQKSNAVENAPRWNPAIVIGWNV